MGVFYGTFIYPPPPMRFNFCLGPPPIRSNYQSTPPPTSSFFSGEPTSKELEEFIFSFFFVFKPKQPTRSHLNEGYLQNYIFEKDNLPLDWKTTNPHHPSKIQCFAFKDPFIFSSGTALIYYTHRDSFFLNIAQAPFRIIFLLVNSHMPR